MFLSSFLKCIYMVSSMSLSTPQTFISGTSLPVDLCLPQSGRVNSIDLTYHILHASYSAELLCHFSRYCFDICSELQRMLKFDLKLFVCICVCESYILSITIERRKELVGYLRHFKWILKCIPQTLHHILYCFCFNNKQFLYKFVYKFYF